MCKRSWDSGRRRRRLITVYARRALKITLNFLMHYTAAMTYSIRDAQSADLDAVLALNAAAVPAVNSIDIEQMRWFLANAVYFRVAADAESIAAFLIGLRPGTSYDSVNYRWFCDNYDDFGYIDRIAVASRARRLGLASRLYADFEASLPSDVAVMTCEVNLEPPNETSMRFHEGHGFRRIGEQQTEGGSKRVALMEKRL